MGRVPGGGVMLVKEELNDRIEYIESSIEGVIWIRFNMGREAGRGKHVCLAFAYCHPKESPYANDNFFEELLLEISIIRGRYKEDGILLLGDWNARIRERSPRYSKEEELKVGSGRSSNDKVINNYGSFQQIGPPRNVSIVLTEEGYIVTWEPPEFGREALKVYTVRWTEGPREILYGRADTTDTFLVVPLLEEGASYVFQVVATSHNDHQAASNKVLVHVPGSRRMRAIAVAVAIGAVFLVVVGAASWYVRQLYLRRHKEGSY
ncbi:uncharacterized protein [Anabrus simplex]|uniref:uncharacterized protein n=1 Tax=Anabrus simplex TaxID=316456 RepID=UPI0035A3CA19